MKFKKRLLLKLTCIYIHIYIIYVLLCIYVIACIPHIFISQGVDICDRECIK